MKLKGAELIVRNGKELSQNATETTVPSASLAFAAIGTVAPGVNVAPSLGDVIDTIGGWLLDRTVTSAAREVAAKPRLSVARAVIECVPMDTLFSAYREGNR